MANATWPADLPQEQFLGSTFQQVDNRLRTQMDVGVPKQRRRYTAVVENHSVPIALSGKALKDTFIPFYDNTLSSGTLPFDWTDIVTDTVATYRFRAPPTWRIDIGSSNIDKRFYTATLELEKLPPGAAV